MAVLAVSRGDLATAADPPRVLGRVHICSFAHVAASRVARRNSAGYHLQEWLQMSTPNYLFDAVAYASHESSTISAMRGRFATSRTKMRRINRSLPSLNTNGMRKSPSMISSTL